MRTATSKDRASSVQQMNFTFRALLSRDRGGWYLAECLDLNILVKAESEKQAVKKLNDAIAGYMRVALEGDPSDLIPRRAPLGRWIAYYWTTFVNLIGLPRVSHNRVIKLGDLRSCAA